MENESAATDGGMAPDERALCTGDSNGENSLFRSDQLFEEREGNIRALEAEKAQKRRVTASGTAGSKRMCIVESACK